MALESYMFTKGDPLSKFLLWEGPAVYSRDTVKVLTGTDLASGTIVEGDDVMEPASAGTARLGMLVEPLKASEEEQDAVVVTRMAVFSEEFLAVPSGIKAQAVKTLTAQGVKLA